MLRKIVMVAAAGLSLAVPAFAEESVVSHPVKAVSLHEGPLDLVAYYRPVSSGAYEVTATFAQHDAKGEPMRIVMAMRDGDAVNFAMPGFRDATYSFTRKGDDISVAVEAVERTAFAN